MRKVLALIMMLMFTSLFFGAGCGKKKADSSDTKVPPETKKAEMMDSTAMDSADWHETEMDSMSHEGM